MYVVVVQGLGDVVVVVVVSCGWVHGWMGGWVGIYIELGLVNLLLSLGGIGLYCIAL
jgi:hypothetical protein